MLKKDCIESSTQGVSVTKTRDPKPGSSYTSKSRREEDQSHNGNSLHRRAIAQRGFGNLSRLLGEVMGGSRITLSYEIVYLSSM